MMISSYFFALAAVDISNSNISSARLQNLTWYIPKYSVLQYLEIIEDLQLQRIAPHQLDAKSAGNIFPAGCNQGNGLGCIDRPLPQVLTSDYLLHSQQQLMLDWKLWKSQTTDLWTTDSYGLGHNASLSKFMDKSGTLMIMNGHCLLQGDHLQLPFFISFWRALKNNEIIQLNHFCQPHI